MNTAQVNKETVEAEVKSRQVEVDKGLQEYLKKNVETRIILQKELVGGGSVILAIWRDKEIVTWLMDDKGRKYLGHYYSQTEEGLAEALEDYKQRS